MKKSNKTPSPLPTASMDQSEYQAQDDANVLRRAGEVMADTKRHTAARAHLVRHTNAIQTIMKVEPASKPPRTPSLGFGKKR